MKVNTDSLRRIALIVLSAVLVVVAPILIKNYGIGYDRIVFSTEIPQKSVVADTPSPTPEPKETTDFVLNTKTKKIHLSTCGIGKKISEEQAQFVPKEEAENTIPQLLQDGYTYCGVCCKNRE